MPALVLASASARRRAYLEHLGVPFEVEPADVDEAPLPGEAPADAARRLARDKAEAVRRRRPAQWILAADTVVAVDSTILGKPADRDDARRMLRLLSHREHSVVTAVVLLDPHGAAVLDEAVTTRVTFRRLEPREIEAYVASGETDDKAGAYAIQGGAATFVTGVVGSYSNVVGLPLEVLEPALERAGLL